MIRLENVSVLLEQKPVLSDVSFQVQQGMGIGIIGPNGAGKSTLLQVMAGFQKSSQGNVLFQGRELSSFKKKELARKMAIMPQINTPSASFTVLETVLLARYPYLGRFQLETQADLEICRNSLERTCTWHLKDRKLDEISGGERQRVLLAQVLSQQPELLLLDEPTTYLDLFHQMELLTLLKQEQAAGLTWVAALHDLNLAFQFCDRILVIHQGKVIMYETPARVVESKVLEEVFRIRISVVKVPGLSVPQVIVTPWCTGHE